MPSLALQLIAANKSSKATFLDLGNCDLSELPAEISDLVWLEGLSLAGQWHDMEKRQNNTSSNSGSKNQLANLKPLAGLSRLRVLHLGGTQVRDLRPLARLSSLRALFIWSTKISDLGPLARLSGLQTLEMSGTQVSDLSPLAGLSGLQTLDASITEIRDLAPLAGLSALQTLRLQITRIRDLRPLARLSGLQTLDVSITQVGDLAPLAGLSSLRELFISNPRVRDLGPLARLSDLQSLNMSSTPVSDLQPLARLPGLQTLDLSNTEVRELGPLGGLSDLQSLNMSSTPVSDLQPLARLSDLQTLNISGTQVIDLGPLARLSGLQALNISGTQVRDLGPLAGLSGLQKLDLSDTQVSDLSPLTLLFRRGLPLERSPKPWAGYGIYVGDRPLTNPPLEIVAQGNAAILNYFEERALGKVDHLYEGKMLILGEGGAGKTSLLRRLYLPDKDLPTEDETTRGIAIYKHEFRMKSGRVFRLNVWDFGGQQIYHATHQFFLTHRSLYVLVDDTRKDNKSVSDEGFKYWLELIEVFGGHSPILIFQNEKGGRTKAIDFSGIKQRYDNVKELYAGDLDRPNTVDKARDGIEFYAANLSHVGEELPARWIKVREEIETLANTQAYIPVEKYFEIYRRHIEFDETKALLLSRYLHDLGVFLHFQDDLLLKRTVILQNEWATNAVFRILDDEAIKKRLGRFDREECARLWKDSDYARMHLELLALMQNFELCYELRDSKPPTWLVPQLLPPAKPKDLGTWAKPDDLVLRYKYDFLPKGIISRLMVRLHRFVRDPEKAWITGALFERDHTAVLVEILSNGSEIELRARGPEHKALLSVIAADLDALNDSFEGLRDKVRQRIPCNCKICRPAPVPEFFDQSALLRRKEHDQLQVQCERSFEYVNVMELLEGIRMEKLPAWANEDSGAGSTAALGLPRTIRIFLASSSELREDRDAFDLYFRTQNDNLIRRGIYLRIIRWEYFLDAMSETRLQHEYNKAVRDCDIFVCLFFTKAGKFTVEEFETAFVAFKERGKPRIFTFFKTALVNIDKLPEADFSSLKAFQKNLRELGHFYTRYENVEDLKLQFRDQLDTLIQQTHLLRTAHEEGH